MNRSLITKADIKREKAVIMGKFDHRFAEILFDGNLRTDNLGIFERCKEITTNEAADEWRLIQIISPAGEKKSPSGGYSYEIVLEKEN